MVHMFIYWLILIIEPLYTVLCYCAYESFLFQNCVLELHFLFTGPVFHTLCYAKRNITTIKINSIFFFQYSVPQSNLLCILTWKDSYNFFSLEFQFFSFLVEKKKICVHNIPQFPIVLIWSFTAWNLSSFSWRCTLPEHTNLLLQPEPICSRLSAQLTC